VALGELASADKKAAEEALEELRSQMEDLRELRAAREAKEAIVSGSKVKTVRTLTSWPVTHEQGRLGVQHLKRNSWRCALLVCDGRSVSLTLSRAEACDDREIEEGGENHKRTDRSRTLIRADFVQVVLGPHELAAFSAARHGREEELKNLLESVHANVINEPGNTLLIVAAQVGLSRVATFAAAHQVRFLDESLCTVGCSAQQIQVQIRGCLIEVQIRGCLIEVQIRGCLRFKHHSHMCAGP
jgi:hypothetical protein